MCNPDKMASVKNIYWSLDSFHFMDSIFLN